MGHGRHYSATSYGTPPLPPPPPPPELVVDGDFEADSPLWNWGVDWNRENSSPPPGGSGYYAYAAFSLGVPPHILYQELNVEFGVLYEFNCVSELSDGSDFAVRFGSNQIGLSKNSPLQGMFVTRKNLEIINFGVFGHTGKLDNISVKRVP